MSDLVEIFTDGACSGNPGPGGWAALLRYGGHEKELSGGEAETTNNRMEMTAVIMALSALKKPSRVRLVTDSRYVMDGITKWIHGWVKRDWKGADKKPVKNRDLWEQMMVATTPHKIDWEWVKGHNEHPENERVDQLAVAACKAVARDK